MRPSFSVIVPVLNGEKTLVKCLESIMSQTYDNYSVILVDNGSTDETANIAKKFNVHYVFEPVQGRSKARNTGARIAASDYLAFVDCDVVLSPDWLYRIHLYLNTYKAQIIATKIVPSSDDNRLFQQYRYFYAETKSHGTFLSLVKFFGVLPVVNSAAFVVEKRAFDLIGGFDTRLKRQEDTEFSLRAFFKGFIIGGTQEATSKVYFNGNLISYLVRNLLTRCYSIYADPAFGRVFRFILKSALNKKHYRLFPLLLVIECVNMLSFVLNRFRRLLFSTKGRSYNHQVERLRFKANYVFSYEGKQYTLKPNQYFVFIEDTPRQVSFSDLSDIFEPEALFILTQIYRREGIKIFDQTQVKSIPSRFTILNV